jgi:hypothetical protein
MRNDQPPVGTTGLAMPFPAGKRHVGTAAQGTLQISALFRVICFPVSRIHELLPWNWKAQPQSKAA